MYYVILQEAAAASANGGGTNIIGAIVPMVAMFAILYFLIIRPQNKKQKDHKNMLGALKINDTVVTSGGIIGKIVNFKEDRGTALIRIDENTNTKIEIQRGTISGKFNEKK
ncbi:MAG: preprotein translocase subunit YajC [Candidatus Cloacimonadota bacterium]|nr:preprotein translocase subunit YajC [Candidatus Cloacimonadota bacterium]